jgi:hypothetical protein
MQLTPDELRFIAEHPQQVHKLLSLSIPDPIEHVGLLRVQDLIQERDENGGNSNGNGNGESEHAPWTEVAPRRATL